MKKFLIIFLLIAFNLHAKQQNYLAFSGGKFGYSSKATESASSSIESSLSRAKDHCHSTSWLVGSIRLQEWDYWIYYKAQVTAKSIVTFGTRRRSCNLPLKVPYVSAKATMTAERYSKHFGWHTFHLKSKSRIRSNTSGLLVRAKDKQFGKKTHSPLMGYSEHIAKGGRIGKKVLKVNLQRKF